MLKPSVRFHPSRLVEMNGKEMNKMKGVKGGKEVKGIRELAQVFTSQNLSSQEQSLETVLHYPDYTEERSIVELNLDFPSVFSKVRAGEGSRRFGRSKSILETNQGTDLTDGGSDYRMLFVPNRPIENLIKAVLNNDTEMIRKTLDEHGDLLTKNVLKFKKRVSYNTQDIRAEKRWTDIEIFVDILHFAVLHRKHKPLAVLLDYVQGDICEVLNKEIRINCGLKNVSITAFDYEDVKLERRNLFHLATEICLDCLKILLQFKTTPDLLLSKDVGGRTAFHIAAGNSGMGSFELLFNAISDRTNICIKKDVSGNTPLHYAVKFGTLDTMLFILTNISSQYPYVTNIENLKGKTPLFYAKDPKSVYLLLNFGANPMTGNCEGRSLLEEYIKVKPENAKALLACELDTNGKELNDKDYLYVYQLRLFLRNPRDPEDGEEMAVISKFGEYNQKKLLNLPGPEVYLHLKWSMIKQWYFLNAILYFVFLISLTSLVYWTSYYKNHPRFQSKPTNQTSCSLDNLKWYSIDFEERYLNRIWILLHVFTLMSTSVVLVREMMQLWSKKSRYFRSKENLLECSILLSSLLYLLCIALTGKVVCESEQAAGAIALFLAWFEMSLMIGRLPSVGIYIYMSVNVIKQLLKFFSVYFTILMAFACSFSIILPKSPTFENLITSFLKVIVMMIGEYDFESNFKMDDVNDQGNENGPSKPEVLRNIITQVLFISLVSMVSITIANLIIGLTVQNIADLQRNAGTYKLCKTLDQIKETEDIFIKNTIFKWFNQRMAFSRHVNKHMRLLSYFEHLLRGHRINTDNVQICINPRECTIEENAFSSNTFKTYLYDSTKLRVGKYLNADVPEWVISNTKKALEEKQNILEELDILYTNFTNSTSVAYNFSYTQETQRLSNAPVPYECLMSVDTTCEKEELLLELDRLDQASNQLRRRLSSLVLNTQSIA